jgi:hypothetical protein
MRSMNSLSMANFHKRDDLRDQTTRNFSGSAVVFRDRDLSLPKLLVDPLKIKLRWILLRVAEVNNIEIWNSRADYDPF